MIDAVLRRLRRKVDIVRLDREVQGDIVYHDMIEILRLLDILERELLEKKEEKP
jgi:hypothetical protein